MQTVRRLANDLPHRQVCCNAVQGPAAEHGCPVSITDSGRDRYNGCASYQSARPLSHEPCCSLALSTIERQPSSLQRKLRQYKS